VEAVISWLWDNDSSNSGAPYSTTTENPELVLVLIILGVCFALYYANKK
jgi:hypothetical protein